MCALHLSFLICPPFAVAGLSFTMTAVTSKFIAPAFFTVRCWAVFRAASTKASMAIYMENTVWKKKIYWQIIKPERFY